jgi:hypothetical protein
MLWKNITTSLFAILPFQFATMPNSAAAAQVQYPLHLLPAPYEAPLRSLGGKPEDLVPGNYGVFLFPGHSLEQHFKAVKIDLTPHIMYIFDAIYKDRVVYSARNIDDGLLAAIRSDPGVEVVDYDYKVSVD